MDIKRVAAFTAIEIPLLTVPMVMPTIPLWAGIACWLIAALLGLYAASDWLRARFGGPSAAEIREECAARGWPRKEPYLTEAREALQFERHFKEVNAKRDDRSS